MKKHLTIVYGILIILTITTAILSKFSIDKIAVVFIVALSGIKFLLVAFHFMELKKGNIFWKVSLTFFLVLLLGIITLLI